MQVTQVSRYCRPPGWSRAPQGASSFPKNCPDGEVPTGHYKKPPGAQGSCREASGSSLEHKMWLGFLCLLALLDLHSAALSTTPRYFPTSYLSRSPTSISNWSSSSAESQVRRPPESETCVPSLPLAFWGPEYNFTDG